MEKKKHRWVGDTCASCLLQRKMQSWKLLMAIDRGRDHYRYGQNYMYSWDGSKWKWDRPDCTKDNLCRHDFKETGMGNELVVCTKCEILLPNPVGEPIINEVQNILRK